MTDSVDVMVRQASRPPRQSTTGLRHGIHRRPGLTRLSIVAGALSNVRQANPAYINARTSDFSRGPAPLPPGDAEGGLRQAPQRIARESDACRTR